MGLTSQLMENDEIANLKAELATVENEQQLKEKLDKLGMLYMLRMQSEGTKALHSKVCLS